MGRNLPGDVLTLYRRLRRVTAREAVARAAQSARRVLHRMNALGWTSPPLELGRNGAFFEGARSRETCAALHRFHSSEVEATIEQARRIERGQFSFFAFRKLDFGSPTDWSLDPTSGVRAPKVHWTRINHLDEAVAGDHKIIWELNRHQWLVKLGQAYALTSEERYATLAVEYFLHWSQENPLGYGINWCSSLECSLRIIAWCWTVALITNSRALRPDVEYAWRRSIWIHAVFVERFLSWYYSPNTHLTGEALGLLYAGVFLNNPLWVSRGQAILNMEILRQVYRDGVHFEQSTCYQQYTFDIALHYLALAAQNGRGIPNEVQARVAAMAHFLCCVATDDGLLPSIGDDDGGTLLPLSTRERRNITGSLSVWHALTGQGGMCMQENVPTPEQLWILGPRFLKNRALLGTPANMVANGGTRQIEVFRAGGYVVQRLDVDGERHQLVMDVGPLGCPHSAGHGHADLLSVQWNVNGSAVLVDPGSFRYTSRQPVRTALRQTHAHNTVLVDQRGHAYPSGLFRWDGQPVAVLRRLLKGDGWTLVEGEHCAFSTPRGEILHLRRLLTLRHHCWIIVDDVYGSGEHRIEARFQFACIPVTGTPNGIRVKIAPNLMAHIVSASTVPLHRHIVSGSSAPFAGWISRDYGDLAAAPQLSVWGTARLPVRLVTAAVTSRPGSSKKIPVRIRAGSPNDVTRIELLERQCVVDIDRRGAVQVMEGRGNRCVG